MSTQEPSIATVPVAEVFPADVEGSRSAQCWTVEERAWKQDLPHLSEEVIALLAAPVVVSAQAWLAVPVADAWLATHDTGTTAPDQPEQAEVERYPSPVEPCAIAPRVLSPALA